MINSFSFFPDISVYIIYLYLLIYICYLCSSVNVLYKKELEN